MIGPAHPAYDNGKVIIGLSGYARTGKDEIANYLVEHHGFERRGFADKLREFLYAQNIIVEANAEHHGMVPTTYFGFVYRRLRDALEEFGGWDGYKNSPFSDDIRLNLQRLGTEAGRDILGNNIWVDALFKDDYDKLVIPDCRFPNEYDGVKARGGTMIRIERLNIKPINAHISEIALDDYIFDRVVHNNGTLDDLKRKAETLV